MAKGKKKKSGRVKEQEERKLMMRRRNRAGKSSKKSAEVLPKNFDGEKKGQEGRKKSATKIRPKK